MSSSSLRIVSTAAFLQAGAGRLGGLPVDAAETDTAVERHDVEFARPVEIVPTPGPVCPHDPNAALGRRTETVAVDPGLYVPDAGLIDALGAAFCALNEVLPLRRVGAATLVVTARPESFAGLRATIEGRIGPVLMATALPGQLNAALLAVRRRHLVQRAETRADPQLSCRTLDFRPLSVSCVIALAVVVIAAVFVPVTLFSVITLLALLVLLANSALGLAAMAIHFRGRASAPPVPPASDTPLIGKRPVAVSIIVPLFHERDIASRLIERLTRIDYPRALLDILLVVEEDDRTTRDTLAETELPPWMRIIEVPRGSIQTKPRALNFALEFCRGTIVGIYDAEDDPDPQQVRHAVEQFRLSPPNVACLQGQLDFYNPHRNWVARCFTIDYAVWFRLILPALARMGLVIPLGGTTLFLRRTALVRLGGWDAHNVTEDADLGVRLARRGYRTDLLRSVTLEEANCRPWPWIRQRSRWQKGYALTWLVHMRDPVLLWRELGARRFFGIQLLFLGSLGGALLAPFLWSFLLLAMGLPHPWSDALGPIGEPGVAIFLAVGMLVQWALGWIALNERGHRGLACSVPLLSLYHLMATMAVLKAVFEMLFRPFYWDKTSHGCDTPALPSAIGHDLQTGFERL
ncbi:glycosyltransferase family 2 protein [Oceaniglobus indicus]|uniref:glycosyltransferase family 2 protein n=1 Tax=Oceaniglobus indicus TaxID=2047749 RepID=UPI001304417B|nr:glycosyltransferase [Oceaniglobus indicus]